MKTRINISVLFISITLLFSASAFAVKPDKPPKPQEPKIVEIDCDASASLTPVQDALAMLNPFGDIYIVRVAGTCDEILTIRDFANITIQALSGSPSFGRLEVHDAGYVTVRDIDLVGPYTTPYERGAIVFSSQGKLMVSNMEASCPVPDGYLTGDCVDGLWINGPGQLILRDFHLIGDWKVGIQTRERANVTLDGGSIFAHEVQVGLRDQSYAKISGTTFSPELKVHAFERSHIDSHVPIDSALVISSYVVGMKADGSAHCVGSFPSAMVDGSLSDGANLCDE